MQCKGPHLEHTLDRLGRQINSFPADAVVTLYLQTTAALPRFEPPVLGVVLIL
jgi:hypothetical protein